MIHIVINAINDQRRILIFGERAAERFAEPISTATGGSSPKGYAKVTLACSNAIRVGADELPGRWEE
jgi:hypothetical protein